MKMQGSGSIVATANAPESRSAESLVDGQLASLHCKLLTDLFLLLRKTKQSQICIPGDHVNVKSHWFDEAI